MSIDLDSARVPLQDSLLAPEMLHSALSLLSLDSTVLGCSLSSTDTAEDAARIMFADHSVTANTATATFQPALRPL